MAAQYGLRTKDAGGAVTLDTTVTSIRSVRMMTVTGNGSYNQNFSIPEITSKSFVVVDALYDNKDQTWSPKAFWTNGQLQLRSAGTSTWQVMVLSQGDEPFNTSLTYGFRSVNGGAKTQIDSVNRVCSVRYGGNFQFGIYWRPGMQAQAIPNFYYKFPSPITTHERPLVFLNAENYMMVSGFYVTGTPGNWTGWGISQAGHYYQYHGLSVSDYMQMKWFVATYQPDLSAVGQYGVKINDAGGSRIFSSASNIVMLTNQPANNSFVDDGEALVVGQVYNASSKMPWTGSLNDYVLANALFSQTYIEQTTSPIINNWGGFLPNNRNILKMYAENFVSSPSNTVSANGRTLFAARPMRPI